MRNLVFYIKGKYRQKIFKNNVLRRIFGPIREEATGAGRIMRSFTIWTPRRIIRIRWTRCRTASREAHACKHFVGKPKRKRALGVPRRRREER
jgi:hypothetical protein